MTTYNTNLAAEFNELAQFMRQYKRHTVVSRAEVKSKGRDYLQAWYLITGPKSGNAATSTANTKE
jgi:hypothetical protein